MIYVADTWQKHIAFQSISMVDIGLLFRKPYLLSIRKTKMQTTFLQISNALSSIFNRPLFLFHPLHPDVECDEDIQNISLSVLSLQQLRSTESSPPRTLAFIFNTLSKRRPLSSTEHTFLRDVFE
ncbi:hypothetical protein CEXT_403421 [Caerostris extrusa]|uniref:Maturase K n=1 Tax=Caerostris extrusa TaxID=172846 RepID=A0AAV4V4K6_CAEEX|nr:hypothetical protein CEXT_403421 [Caerostris extrusa]